MYNMDELEKLRVLLPHWIEHNQGHGQECAKWAKLLEEGAVKECLEAALEATERVSANLEKALAAAGGAVAADAKGQHHHHH